MPELRGDVQSIAGRSEVVAALAADAEAGHGGRAGTAREGTVDRPDAGQAWVGQGTRVVDRGQPCKNGALPTVFRSTSGSAAGVRVTEPTMPMKPLQLMCLCGLLAIITLARAPAQPGRLRCEYLDHPLAVEARVPRLSWLMETSGELRRGLRQTAWRVLVASTPERLARDEGDLWDSGKVASDQSIQIGYAGKPLPSRQRCHWKVMVWAQDGKPSAWSAPAEWRMGLLKPEDWHGKWITIKTAEGLAHPWLRRTFDLQAVPGEARIYINTPSHYELYVNGKKVGGDVLAPAHVQLSKRFHYNVRDLSGLLRPGKNCVALWMGPGWYQPRYGNPYHAPIVRAQLEFADNGGTTLIPTDSTWRVADSCLSQVGSWSHNNFGGERWDARRYVEGWNQPDFADSGWAEAIEIPAPAVAHSWQALPGSRLGTPEPPQRIYPHDGKWVVDFGKNFTGWMRCRVTGLKPGQEITIDYADLDPARRHLMHVPNKANGFQTFNQQDSYVAGHQTEDVFCSKFNHHGFRYAVITGLSRAPEVGDAAAMMITTDLDQAGEFSCSNELFNRIHEVTVRSCLTQTRIRSGARRYRALSGRRRPLVVRAGQRTGAAAPSLLRRPACRGGQPCRAEEIP